MKPRRQLELDLRRWLRSHHGVIGYTEALRLGASPGIVRSKVDRGEWERMHRGVYRDTATPVGPYQDLRAACVVTAGLGVASHASAAWLWGLLARPPDTPEVTVPLCSRHSGGHVGLTVHRSRDLDLAATVEWNKIPVTNPLRTLVDLAGCVAPGALTEAVDNAVARHLVPTSGLEAEIERLSRRGRRGVGVLRRHLLERGYIGAPRPSVLEAHARRLVLRTGLPLPAVELRLGTDAEYRLDLAWSEVLFAVEVDGYTWHFSPEHTERDEARRRDLRRMGWTLLVYTWRQILREPERVAREITETYRQCSQQEPPEDRKGSAR